MQKQLAYVVATYHPGTHPGFMASFFLAGAVLWTYLMQMYADDLSLSWQLYFASALFLGCALYYGFKWVHSVRFTEYGVLLCRFGKEYRRIPWVEIKQAGIAKEYKATRLTLVFTPEGCPLFDCVGASTSYVEKYRFQVIRVDATKENIAAAKRFYGELDYQVN